MRKNAARAEFSRPKTKYLPAPARRFAFQRGKMSHTPLRAHIGDYRQYEFAECLDATLALFSRRLREKRLNAAALLAQQP